MNHTENHFLDIQSENHLKLSLEERFNVGLSMIEDCFMLVEQGVINRHSELSKSQVKAEAFRIIYADDFDSETLNNITDLIEKYHESFANL